MDKIEEKTILCAISGDCVAINDILRMYDKYINQLCIRPLFDENGCQSFYMDTNLKSRLQTKLILATTQFKV